MSMKQDKRQKTRIYYERDGSERAKAEVEAVAARIVSAESEEFARDQVAAKYLIKDIRKQRAYDKSCPQGAPKTMRQEQK